MDNSFTSPQQISSLITFQTGAVVSRELVSAKTGNITLFAFDENQGLSEHSAPFDAFLQILEGVAVVTLDGQLYDVKSGDFIVFPANHPHSLKAKTPLKLLLVMIKS